MTFQLIFLNFLIFVVLKTNAIKFDIFMPEVHVNKSDTYLCYNYKINSSDPIYITEFIPKSPKNTAHHMLLYSCDEPGSQEIVWNCNEMNGINLKYESAPTCKSNSRILFSWALDAPQSSLPKDVAFQLNANQNIVLQVHYASAKSFKNGRNDSSGFSLIGQLNPLPKSAAILLLMTSGYILKNSTEHFEVACPIEENLTLHVFAYRVHAHKLGIVNSGYKVSLNNKTGKQEWTEIGRRSPQLPQLFNSLKEEIVLKKDDIVAARCTMYNYVNHTVYIGPTSDDEMCNFYIMYYVEGNKTLPHSSCGSNGPPRWYFGNFMTFDGVKLDTTSIPENANELPKTNETMHHHL